MNIAHSKKRLPAVTTDQLAGFIKLKLQIDGTVKPHSDLELPIKPLKNRTATKTIKGMLFECVDKKRGTSYIAILK